MSMGDDFRAKTQIADPQLVEAAEEFVRTMEERGVDLSSMGDQQVIQAFNDLAWSAALDRRG